MAEEQTPNEDQQVREEEYVVSGDDLVGKVKELVHEGNIRRISLKNEEGKTLIELPLTVGVAGAVAIVLVLPVLAALGAIAALVTKCTIVIERIEPTDSTDDEPSASADDQASG